MGAETQVLPEWIEVRNQEELEQALTHEGTIPVCIGDDWFSVEGYRWVIVSDLATVAISDGFVQAGGAATILADGTVVVDAHDRTTVRAKGETVVWARDRTQVSASESSRVSAWSRGGNVVPVVRATDRAAVEAKGAAAVEAYGDATVRAYQRALVNAHDRATVCAWGEATVRAHGNATVYAWGQARVDAAGPVRVEAWQAASVRARGSCEVHARGATTVELRGKASAKSMPHATVLRRTAHRQEVEQLPSSDSEPAASLEWCRFYGVDTTESITLYAAVNDAFRAPCGTEYVPGSVPEAAGSRDGQAGDGNRLFAHPSLALEFAPAAAHFVACPVHIGDLSPHSPSLPSAQVEAQRIRAPVYEVDLAGQPIR
jgi:hypothetical protein